VEPYKRKRKYTNIYLKSLRRTTDNATREVDVHIAMHIALNPDNWAPEMATLIWLI
jgi:hypothetical protein